MLKTFGNAVDGPDAAVGAEAGDVDSLGHTARIRIAEPDVHWERLRCILDLSFDYYWELDKDLRVSQIWHTDAVERRRIRGFLVGRKRWEVGGNPVNGTWEQHRAVLEAHQEFDDFVVEWTNESGQVYFLRYAGRPRYDDDGRFVGYMGISQDVTDEIYRQRLESLELTVTKSLIYSEIAPNSLTRVLDAFCEAFGWRFGRFWRPAGTGETLKLVASTKVREHRAVEEARAGRPLMAAPDSHIAKRWSQYRAGIPRAAEGEDPFLDDFAGDRIVIPLADTDDCFGVLEFGGQARLRIQADRAAAVRRIANHMCIALANERAMRLLRHSEERFASTVELAAIGICHVDLDGRLIHVNGQMADMLGYSKDELVGMNVRDISHPDDVSATEELRKKLYSGEIDKFRLEKRYVRRDGTSVWVRINTVMKWSDDGEALHNISVVEDISENKSAEARIEHLATHDELTGLPNRALFGELLRDRLDAAHDAGNAAFAVLFVDLDRFKSINDSLGHHTGDAVLTAVANRIRGGIRASDRVARLGGDEFVVILEEIKDGTQAHVVAEEILRSLHLPITVGNRQFRVTASIGVAIFPDDGSDAETLLRHADMAMYSAKEGGRNGVCRFDTGMGTTSVRQLTLEAHLANGLEREEFLLQYQPRVDALTGQLLGAEALMRWWNRELGTISPVQFIPVAEETGLILPLGRWAIEKACEDAVRWQRKTGRRISISVNLSPRQFRDSELLPHIRQVLESTGLEPEQLELEITESAVMVDLDQAVRIAHSIREMGIRLALDDFGTGYSSLAQLRRIPLDILKIDRSFVRDIATSEEDRTITSAVVAMAKQLGIAVVAEGVETAEQYAVLSQLRCDQLQGFFFGEPSHPDEIVRLLRSEKLRALSS